MRLIWLPVTRFRVAPEPFWNNTRPPCPMEKLLQSIMARLVACCIATAPADVLMVPAPAANVPPDGRVGPAASKACSNGNTANKNEAITRRIRQRSGQNLFKTTFCIYFLWKCRAFEIGPALLGARWPNAVYGNDPVHAEVWLAVVVRLAATGTGDGIRRQGRGAGLFGVDGGSTAAAEIITIRRVLRFRRIVRLYRVVVHR